MEKRPRTGATAILGELIKLKSQQKYLDASQTTLNPHKYDLKEEMAQINDVENLKTELDINLLAFFKDMHNETVHVMGQLKEFQETMLKPASVQQYNIKQYREQLFQLDRAMREADEHNAMELKRLRNEYSGMEEELSVLANENLLRQHRKSLNGKWSGVTTMMRTAVSAPIDRNDNDDIKQFDRFVNERGGHTGGWSDEEHHLFIKLRTKYKSNIERICMELQTMLTGVYERFLTSRHSGSGRGFIVYLSFLNVFRLGMSARHLRVAGWLAGWLHHMLDSLHINYVKHFSFICSSLSISLKPTLPPAHPLFPRLR